MYSSSHTPCPLKQVFSIFATIESRVKVANCVVVVVGDGRMEDIDRDNV